MSGSDELYEQAKERARRMRRADAIFARKMRRFLGRMRRVTAQNLEHNMREISRLMTEAEEEAGGKLFQLGD